MIFQDLIKYAMYQLYIIKIHNMNVFQTDEKSNNT